MNDFYIVALNNGSEDVDDFPVLEAFDGDDDAAMLTALRKWRNERRIADACILAPSAETGDLERRWDIEGMLVIEERNAGNA